MSKRVKYFSFAIAIIAVAAVMTIAIYAATAASAGITANVSWTATEGIAFELEAWVVNNSTANGIGATTIPKSISKQIVTASTSNTAANNLAGDLACGFYDGSDDGVNNPSNIVFTYKIKNTGSNVLKVTATKTPTNSAESGTTAANHKPAVALSSKLDGSNNTSSCISSLTGSGYNIAAGKTLEYIVTLSISNADLSITNYDAGVTFSLTTGETGIPTIYIDGVQQSSPAVDGATTVGDYLDALDGSQYPGYFYDEDLTIYAGEDDIVTNDTKLYTKPATLDKLTFTSNGDGTYSVADNYSSGGVSPKAQHSNAQDKIVIGANRAISAVDYSNIVIPREYNGALVTKTTGSAFSQNYAIKTVVIPDSVTSIGNYAFGYCTSLTGITIPDSVTSIGDSAFDYCTSLTSIIVSSGNEVYDSRNNCNAIIKTASNALIWGCKNTVIPNNVTRIGGYAFAYCPSLTGITIPDSVTSIGIRAFSGCSGLTSIIVSSGNEVYDSRNNCNAIIETASNTLIAGFKNTIIPDSVTSIGERAFYGCTSLTSITIGDGVTSIGNYAFESCENLTSITIGDSVTSIGNYAFGYCTSLTGITIPDSVTSIGEYAFDYCTSLTSITIGDSVTSIGNYAFGYCTSLTSIYIPSSVTTITASSNSTYSLFRSCSSSLKIYCGASSKPSGWGTYWNYYNNSTALSTTWGVTREQYNSQYA